jgi:hypothetical protein
MPRSDYEMISEAMKTVSAKWWAEFQRFVQCGEASEEFLAFLEQSEECRAACDAILEADDGMSAIIELAQEEVLQTRQ